MTKVLERDDGDDDDDTDTDDDDNDDDDDDNVADVILTQERTNLTNGGVAGLGQQQPG